MYLFRYHTNVIIDVIASSKSEALDLLSKSNIHTDENKIYQLDDKTLIYNTQTHIVLNARQVCSLYCYGIVPWNELPLHS
jgi:hypothetical protein